MDCVKYLRSLSEAASVVSAIQEKRIPGILGLAPYRQEYYRGQVSESFVLKPSLARPFTDAADLQKTEALMMAGFESEMRAQNKMAKLLQHDPPRAFQNDWAWIGQAQHYRLPTRMLDWTLSWEVALYFAVENVPAFAGHDAQFWVIYVPDEMIMHDGKKEIYYDTDPYKLDQTWFVNPSFFWSDNYGNEGAEARRARQHGKFTIQAYGNSLIPLEEQPEIIPLLEKYCIPADAKDQIRLELAAKGVHGDFLYASEDAAINDIVASLRKKYNV